MEKMIDFSKLEESQLEELKKFFPQEVSEELSERERLATYINQDEAMFKDLSSVFMALRPMYDNMRNNDFKKTLTSSQLFPVLEKVIRTAKAKGYNVFSEIKKQPAEDTQVQKISKPKEEPSVMPTPEKVEDLGLKPQVDVWEELVPTPKIAQVFQEKSANPTPAVEEVVAPAPAPAPAPENAEVSLSTGLCLGVSREPTLPPMPQKPNIDPERMSIEEINAIMNNTPILQDIPTI